MYPFTSARKNTIIMCLSLAVMCMYVMSCKKDDALPLQSAMQYQVVPLSDTLPAVITQHTLLTSAHPWYIKGWLYVTNEASLHMEAGTVVNIIPAGRSASCGIVVTRGSKLLASGTPIFPVNVHVGGIGGGIVLLGKAPVKNNGIYNKNTWLSGAKPAYGGNLRADSSGSLEYLNIIYTPATDKEDTFPGGLLLLGTGNKTKLKEITLQQREVAVVTARKLR